MLRDQDSDAIRAELRWAGKRLAPVRDLDVLIARLRKAGDPDMSLPVLKEAERLRADAFESLLDTLSNPRFMKAILKAATWIESGRWLTRRKSAIRTARELPAQAQAAQELSRLWAEKPATSFASASRSCVTAWNSLRPCFQAFQRAKTARRCRTFSSSYRTCSAS
jgi:CHAD domain-containing protein